MKFAVFLLSSFLKFVRVPNLWCQERDSNPRPPAYESEMTNMGRILTKKTLTMLKYGYIIDEVLKNKNILMKCCTCLLTNISLNKGQKKDIFCRIFADQFIIKINLYECLSISYSKNRVFNLVSPKAQKIDRHSYKLILKREKKLIYKIAIKLNKRVLRSWCFFSLLNYQYRIYFYKAYFRNRF